MSAPSSVPECGAVAPDRTRRRLLTQLATLAGLTLCGDALAAVEGGAQGRGPLFLTPAQLTLTGALAEHIIPATETAGALSIGAHHVIDRTLALCSHASARLQFANGLARLDERAVATKGGTFLALPHAAQVAMLHALDASQAPFTAADHAFFTQLKSLTLFAYYTSEEGASRELIYLPVPGGFKGDVPVSVVGRRWAL